MQARLPFNNLNAFAAAAETLSFQDASEILHVTPSAVSHQIRNLESILGYKLFERLDKKIRLTTKGKKLYSEINEPLKQLHDASYRALHDTETNTLALSVAPIFATKWLLKRLKNFHTDHPEVSLSVVATTSMVDFRSDPFDAAIRIGHGNWPDTNSELLFKRCSVAVCNPQLIKRYGGQFSAKDLVQQDLIHVSALKGMWEEWFESANIRINSDLGGLEVQNTSQLLEAVDTGESIGLVDPNFIHTDLESGRLAIACEHIQTCDDGYFLSWPETAKDLASLKTFKQWLLEEAKNHMMTM